jgi:hypothetical protein
LAGLARLVNADDIFAKDRIWRNFVSKILSMRWKVFAYAFLISGLRSPLLTSSLSCSRNRGRTAGRVVGGRGREYLCPACECFLLPENAQSRPLGFLLEKGWSRLLGLLPHSFRHDLLLSFLLSRAAPNAKAFRSLELKALMWVIAYCVFPDGPLLPGGLFSGHLREHS